MPGPRLALLLADQAAGNLASHGQLGFWLIVGAFAGWLLVLAGVARANRPHEPSPGPSTLDLGPEPPAVANFLAHGWQLTPDAAPATLLDLAGRHLLDIDQVGPGRVLIRLRQRAREGLTPYEGRVLEHVEQLALDGVVPAQALATGPSEEATAWWKGFRGEVVADARRRGLSRNRWSRPTLVWLAALALVPAGLLALTTTAFALGIIAWLVLLALLGSFGDQRDTPAGLQAAGRWLGVRKHLADDPTFADLPPAAVATWDRYLAYGAALGVAPAAVRALPMGMADEHRAWSSYGGGWRVVQVRYPGEPARMPRNRLLAALASGAYELSGTIARLLLGIVAVFAPLLLVAAILLRAARDNHPGLPAAPRLAFVLGAAGSAVSALLLARALQRWLAGRADRRAPREYEGSVLRLRNKVVTHHDDDGRTHYEVHCFAAVDDGHAPLVRAYEISESLYNSLREGSIVRVAVGARTGRLLGLELEHHAEGSVPPPPIHRGDGGSGLLDGVRAVFQRAADDDETAARVAADPDATVPDALPRRTPAASAPQRPGAGAIGAVAGLLDPGGDPAARVLQRLQQRAAAAQARRGGPRPMTPGRKVVGCIGAVFVMALVVALLVGVFWVMAKLSGA